MRKVGRFVAVVTAPAFIVVFAAVLLVSLSVTGPIFEAVDANQGPGDAGKGDVDFGTGILLFASMGLASIPTAIILSLMFGNKSSDRPVPQRRGPF